MRHILSVVTIFQYCTESVQLKAFSNMYYSRNFQASKHSLFLVWVAVFDSEKSGRLNVVKVQLLGWP